MQEAGALRELFPQECLDIDQLPANPSAAGLTEG
jgi:hypothetical protein